MSEITVYLRHAKRSHASDIDLSNKQLSSIPKDLFSMRNVERLNISHNKIEFIESNIAQLYKLRELDISYNSLTELPEQIASIPLLSVFLSIRNPLASKYSALLLPQNQRNPYLAEALRQCFDSQKSEKAPSWLIEPGTQKGNSNKQIMWTDSPLRLDKTFSRRGERRKLLAEKQQNFIEPESIFNNGVLQIKFEDLEIGEQISMGGFSTIHKGRYMGSEVAIKKVFNPNITQELMSQFNNQIAMLSKYRHPNIVLLIGAVSCAPNLCIVMQYFKQGTLYDLLHRKKVQLTDDKRRLITTQIIQVIQFLHKLGIVHRDLKSHNILINSFFQAKLCDFGLAKHKSQLNTGPMQYSGTPTYMAPQLLLKKSYGPEVDIFALGTMLYQIYTGQVPYQGYDPADLRDKVLKDTNLPHKIGMKKSIIQIS